MVFRADGLAPVSRYGLAATLAGLAVLASVELAPPWSPRYLLWPCYPAVMLSAWLGGVGPGLVTALGSTLAITYGASPIQSLWSRDPGDLLGAVLFLSVGVLLNALSAQNLEARRRVATIASERARETDERKTTEAVAARLVTIVAELQTAADGYRERLDGLAGVFRARRDGRIVECNDLFVRLLGAASARQVLALNMRDLFLDPGQWQALAGTLTREGTIDNEEFQWRRDNGAPLTVRATFCEADGFVEGIAVASTASDLP